MLDSAAVSTSRRPAVTASASVADALVSELCRQGAEVDALLREKDTELDAARRRAAELEERLRQAAAEGQAWCGLARTNEAIATGLRSALDTLLLRGGRTSAQLAPAGAPLLAGRLGRSW
ncbi:hypothetical protein BAE44_0008148 [Dichanthelium oligosanthes]|uniref:Uncharacterized protein n=1 Tax=Dichanthelium oligosanthes TaxID=888268 RepID=A0A1E5W0C5_9POAL|nr:hypothetical protein BAE44_0008148 [Dichanthelium oligosanthes]